MRSPLDLLHRMRQARRAEKKGIARCEHFPFRLIVESSSICNLRCPMCPASLSSKFTRGLMKSATFQKVIDEAASFVHEVDLSHRGEPLLNNRLPAMIGYAHERRIATHLSTNATHLTEELSLRLIQSGLASVTFSVDGLDNDGYESVRVGADFHTVVDNIVGFLKMRRRLRSRTPAASIEVLDLPQAPVAREKAVRFLARFRSLAPVTLAMKTPHTWAGAIQLDRSNEPFRTDRLSHRACPFVWNAMVILSDGNVALCPQDWYNENCLGNIHDATLEEMWNGWTLTFVRRLLASREHRQIELCSQCDLPRRRRASRFGIVKRETLVRDRIPRPRWTGNRLLDMR